MLEQRTKIRRLVLWFGLNMIIFILCYLNYRLQLKHRYLFKTLNVGLCFSRAAAMVINFNLLLVWMPMCKYSLTWIAYLANSSLRNQKVQQQRLRSSLESNQHQLVKQRANNGDGISRLLLKKLKLSIESAISRVQLSLCSAKISSTNSFLLAVDHCKSVHTICATTITVASVIHTVAHLMNVINFSKHYDPILSDLNMAEYKGQNPLQLLVSIPGITGILMLLILILMSLSSLDFIRSLSFDLFQIFHRLSIIFVILLVLHPVSHVLKEQSNVARHHPELCYNNSIMIQARLASNSLNVTGISALVLQAARLNDAPLHVQPIRLAQNARGKPRTAQHGQRTFTTPAANGSESYSVNSKEEENNNPDLSLQADTNGTLVRVTVSDNRQPSPTRQLFNKNRNSNKLNHHKTDENHEFRSATAGEGGEDQQTGWTTAVNSTSLDQRCLDPMPLFVAQYSICWYALSGGLSCYLLDLMLRKRRRSKGTIQLLNVRADSEGNLIELIFNNNHKRFTHWLPGQFVYLNCPQVANFEWHPFTISSMDNANRLFTLHIKTGGDWTRKLRAKLGLSPVDSNSEASCDSSGSSSSGKDSMSNLSAPILKAFEQGARSADCKITMSGDCFQHETPILPDLVLYNESGKPLVKCTKLIRISYDGEQPPHSDHHHQDCDGASGRASDSSETNLYSISRDLCCDRSSMGGSSSCGGLNVGPLDLYIDGPFHSPFERLLEQRVSIGIANGVGWTAFSSAFQCVTNELAIESNKFSKDWWKRQHQLYLSPAISTTTAATATIRNCQFDRCSSVHSSSSKPAQTKLHLMVIVTSVEQLRPFYKLALNYFDRINECISGGGSVTNPVREITAFITRTNKDDKTVTDFCARENMPLLEDGQTIRVNKTFKILLGRPDFEKFLGSLRATYADEKRISVYCCGSNQVKRIVRELCRDLNKTVHTKRDCQVNPLYSYHEESF